MDSAIISALIALAGSVIGTFAGVLTSSKLTEYRLKELEKKVEKHNNLVERMFVLEDRINVHEEKIRVANHRIDDLEGK